MSSGLAESAMEGKPHTVDDEAYDMVPTYDEVFPELPTSGTVLPPCPTPTGGGVKPGMVVRSSVVTQVGIKSTTVAGNCLVFFFFFHMLQSP